MLRTLVPPELIVVPSDVPGDHDDATLEAILAAVTATIEGPEGWLGRALGEQTLELGLEQFDPYCIQLPCRPIIEVESITYLDAVGVEHDLDLDSFYRLAGSELHRRPGSSSLPSTGCFPDAVRIRYRAGYDGNPPDEGGTGDIPAQAKQAIIISAQHLLSLGTENLYTSAETVDGVGSTQYVVSQQANQLIETTCDRLLQGLRVYR